MVKPDDRKVQTQSPAGPPEYADLISDTAVLFGAAKLIPEVVDNVTDQVHMSVFMDGRQVSLGSEVSLEALAAEPQVRLAACADTDVFTLLMVDPDMPSPHKPKYKDTLYWMVTNIKGKDMEHADYTVGYMPPEPAQGRHRYVLLLFKHPRGAFMQLKPPHVRVNFQTKQWAKEHGLGDPVAGLFVTAQHK